MQLATARVMVTSKLCMGLLQCIQLRFVLVSRVADRFLKVFYTLPHTSMVCLGRLERLKIFSMLDKGGLMLYMRSFHHV